MSERLIAPADRLAGVLRVPGDKSISHRAVLFAALADGTSRIDHFLPAADCLTTVRAFRDLGVRVAVNGERVTVTGRGLDGLRAPRRTLDMGNSGTTARLLLGLLAGQRFSAEMTGDASLSRRPMARVTAPLRKMGARIQGRESANYLPIRVTGGDLRGIRYANDLASAQVKSAILLAGLYAEGETVVEERIPSRDHTERFLKICGAPFQQRGRLAAVRRAKRLSPFSIRVPGDFSSAAFFLTAALFLPSRVQLQAVSVNPTRTGYLDVLRAMGAKIRTVGVRRLGEPTADLVVEPSELKAPRLARRDIPRLIDELPLLMLAAARLKGETVLTGIAELRVKESDRLHQMAVNLKRLGVRVWESRDGVRIEGRGVPLRGGSVETASDHRLAMTFAVAGLLSERGVRVKDAACVKISYPGFFRDLESLRG